MLKIVQSIINVIIGAIMMALGSLLVTILIIIIVSLVHPVGYVALAVLPSIGFVATIIGFIVGGIVTAYSIRDKTRKEKPKNSG